MSPGAFRAALMERFPLEPLPANPLWDNVYEGVHENVGDIRTAIEGRRWTEIDLLVGSKNALMSAFSFLKAEAKLYYMPGFMVAFLKPAVRAHNDCLLDVFMERIDPRRSGDEEFDDLILDMDRQQSALVTCFLLEIVRLERNPVAIESLENYWDIFEKDIPKELCEPDPAEQTGTDHE